MLCSVTDNNREIVIIMAESVLTNLRNQCIDSLYLCRDNVLKYLDEEIDSELEKLKNCMREYCAMEAVHVLEEEARVRATRETDASNINSLENKYKAHLQQLQTERGQNFDNHPFILEFEKRVTSSQNLDESDIAITETPETFIDPLTLKRIEDPVRNTNCGHIYERATILLHIQGIRAKKCPVVGCVNQEPMQACHLVDDEALRMRLAVRHSAPHMDYTDSQ